MGIIGDIADSVKDFFNSAGEETVARAGGVAYVLAANTISLLNRDNEPKKLDAQRKALLRPKFDGLVDDVDIRYNAQMIELEVMGKQIGANPAAQTFGTAIYVEGPYKANDDAQLELLAHEIVHSKQYRSADSSLYGFGERYFREWYRGGCKYAENDMEEDADRFAACFMRRIYSTVKYDSLWKSDWAKGWTSLVALPSGADVFVLLYNKAGGAAKVLKVKPDGLGVNTVWEGDWSSGWTTIMPFCQNGAPHILGYKIDGGAMHISRLKAGGAGFTKLGEGDWSSGWSHMMPFVQGGVPHYLAYKTADGGKVSIGRIKPDGTGTTGIWSDDWSEGWTSFHPFVHAGTPHFLAYKMGGGRVIAERVNAGGNGVTKVWEGDWSSGWTIFTPLSADGKEFLALKGAIEMPMFGWIPGNGTAHASSVGDPSNGTSTKWCDMWRGSWKLGTSFPLNGAYHTLIYGADSDEVAIARWVP